MKRHSTLIGIAVLFLAALFITSCSSESGLTIQKRHYGKGYYVHRSSSEREEAVAANTGNAAVSENATNTPATENVPAETTQNAVTPPAAKTPQGFASEKTAHKTGKATVATTQQTAQAPAAKKHPNATSKTTKQKTSPASGGDVDLVLLVILAILLPPLAIFLSEGATNRFWLDLILALLAFSAFFFTLGGLLWLIAIIIALIAVLKG